MNKAKLVVLSLAALFILWIILWLRLFGSINSENPRSQKTSSPIVTQTEKVEGVSDEIPQASIVIDFGNGRKVTDRVSVSTPTTAYDILVKTLQKEKLELKTKKYDFGVFVESVDGFASTADKAWIYYINSVSGTVAADQYTLHPGDMVDWKYIPPSE